MLVCVLEHTCNCVAGSVMSIRNYFRPINGLSEPTGCTCHHVPSPESQGTSSRLCTRSAEYFLHPVTAHSIVPPRWRNSKHTHNSLQGKCPMIVPFSQPCTAYQSECFRALFHTPPLQPPPSLVVSNTTIPFEKLFHGSYSLRMFLPTSHLLCSLCPHVMQKSITL